MVFLACPFQFLFPASGGGGQLPVLSSQSVTGQALPSTQSHMMSPKDWTLHVNLETVQLQAVAPKHCRKPAADLGSWLALWRVYQRLLRHGFNTIGSLY